MGARRWVRAVEGAWDRARLRRAGGRSPRRTSGSRRTAATAAPPRASSCAAGCSTTRCPPEAVEGEGVRAAVRRTVRHFVTDELPGVPLRVTVAGAAVETVTDQEGYFLARLRPGPDAVGALHALGPSSWRTPTAG